MKIGIILAVSEYNSPLSSLPGCITDATVFNKTLECQEDIKDILLLNEDTESASVKSRLAEFVKKHQRTLVDQVILYYTGHGIFQNNDFYYPLSDYDPTRHRQTSLQNSELDGLLRSLSPSVTVKIVDACQSGVHYIKAQDSINQFLKGTQEGFNSCYFLYSSRNTESSYQSSRLSHFTKVIAEAIVSHKVPNLRYKDLIDYASDAFSKSNAQTPFFVTQADFTDIFCTVNKNLRDTLNEILEKHRKETKADGEILQDNIVPAATPALIASVEAEAKTYCTEAEAFRQIDVFRKELEGAKPDEEVAALYELSLFALDNYEGVPSFEKVGQWFEEREHDFFAEEVVRSDKKLKQGYQLYDPFNTIRINSINALGLTDDRYETYYTTIGAKSLVELPYCYLKYHAGSRFPNVRSKALIIIPFVSRTKMLLFSCIAHFEQDGWDNERMITQVKWQQKEVFLKNTDEIKALVHDELLPSFWKALIEPVVERFRKETNEDVKIDEVTKDIEE